MKIQLCTIALSGMLATGVVFAQAAGSMDNGASQQGSNMQQGSGMHHHGMEMQSPDERLARMTKKYNLTADQQSQIKPIFEDEQKQMQAMHSDTSMTPKDRQDKWKSMRDTDSQKIEAVLNDNQKKMFEADQQKMEQKMAMHHQQHMQGSNPDQQSAPQQ
jgi:periplasmic protein CpxP/Spy